MQSACRMHSRAQMAEYCGTAALANAVVISWSCFPSSSAFEGPSASLRHQPRRPCRVTRHTAGSAGSSHRYIAHAPASICLGKVARQFLNRLASAQISAVTSTRRAFPIFFGGKVCGNGNSETNFFRRATNCPGWAWAAKSAVRASNCWTVGHYEFLFSKPRVWFGRGDNFESKLDGCQ